MLNLCTAYTTHRATWGVCVSTHTHFSWVGKVTHMLTCSHDSKSVVSRNVSLLSPCQVLERAPGAPCHVPVRQNRNFLTVPKDVRDSTAKFRLQGQPATSGPLPSSMLLFLGPWWQALSLALHLTFSSWSLLVLLLPSK